MGDLNGDGQSKTDPVELAVIDKPYLLVTSIACYVDDDGTVWIDPLWNLDLVEHLSYLTDFTLCAPSRRREPGLDLVRFDVPQGARISFEFLPSQKTFLRALFQLPRTIALLWRAVGRAEIVHSSVIGWPFPLGWVANPFALLRGKRLVIVVESSWLIEGAGRADLKHRLMDMNALRTRMARWSCNHAHLALFTQAAYRDILCTRGKENAHVTPAVWVNDADILDDDSAKIAWAAKMAGPVKLLFAGRLVSLKGVDVLLASLRSLEARGIRASVDIIGQGEARAACVQAASEFHTVRISVLDPIPYGRPFFELVRKYHAVLVPSLSDEQPRIVFDAYSQSVPVIASDTDGLRPHVDKGRTGWLVPIGDVEALASAIARADQVPSELRAMGRAALETSRGLTHKAMHRERLQLLREHCG